MSGDGTGEPALSDGRSLERPLRGHVQSPEKNPDEVPSLAQGIHCQGLLATVPRLWKDVQAALHDSRGTIV